MTESKLGKDTKTTIDDIARSTINLVSDRKEISSSIPGISRLRSFYDTFEEFIDDWNDPIITPDIFRIFSKKLPARHAVDAYISQVKAQLLYNEYIERKSVDTQKQRSSLSEWSAANETTSNSLDRILKEPRSLLFFVGAIVEFTCNVDKKNRSLK